VAGVAVALGAAGVLTGLLATSSTAKLPPITVRPLVSASQIRLPVDSYVPSFADQVLAGQALTKVADACLAAHHVAVPLAFLGHVNPPLSALNDSTVLWLSQDSARRYGFDPPSSASLDSFHQTVWAHGGVLGISPAQSDVLYDLPASSPGGPMAPATGPASNGGCFGAAAAVVAAHVGAVPMLSVPADAAKTVGLAYYELVWPGLPLQIEVTAAHEADADPRVASDTQRWQACMSKSGYHYQSPQDALGDPRWSAATADASSQRKSRPLEFAVATADARCQQQVNYGGTRLAVLTADQDQLISAHAGQLRVYEQEFTKLVADARLILAGEQS
jgi:hypothetical protein